MAERDEVGAVPSESAPASYAEAIDELEAILAQLDADALDVDGLAAQVARAAALLAFCRTRLDAAQVEVDRVVADLSDA
jgi:exodeoxyribonuclease VII small subunit